MIKYELNKVMKTLFILLGISVLAIIISSIILDGNKKSRHSAALLSEYKGVVSSTQLENYKKDYKYVDSLVVITDPEKGISYNLEILKAKGEYFDTIGDDWTFLGEINKICRKVDDRLAFIEKVEKQDNYSSEYYDKDYDKKYIIADTKEAELLIKNSNYGIAAVIAAIVIAIVLVEVENKSRLSIVIYPTKNGGDFICANKVTVGVLLSISMVLLGFVTYFLTQFILLGYGKNELSLPLYYIEGFEFAPSGITVGKYMLIELFSNIVITITFMMLTLGASMLIRKAVLTSSIVGIIACTFYALEKIYYRLFNGGFDTTNKYIVATSTFGEIYSKFKVWLFLSLLDIKFYFEQPRYFAIGKIALYQIFIPILLCSIISIGLGILFTKKYKFPRKELIL